MAANLLAGLVSGLVVTLLVLVCRTFWNAVIIPWFEERVYKDVKIEGKWFGLYPNQPSLQQDLIVLERRGHAITGKIICIKGPDEGEEYIVTGSFRNMLLPLTYETTDKKKSDRGSLTLMSVRNGERLTGKMAIYNTLEDSIEPVSIIWFRSKDELEIMAAEIFKKKDQIAKLEMERKRIAKEERKVEDADKEE